MSAAAKQPPPAPAASPVVVVHDARGGDRGDDAPDGPAKKRAKPSTAPPPPPVAAFHPASPALLDALLHPLPRNEFLDAHFRRNAVHVSRGGMSQLQREALVSDLHRRLGGLDVRRLFEETSSETVFLWLRPPASSSSDNGEGAASAPPLHSVELTDPETAYALHMAGNHPAYCRAPPDVERDLVGSLLGATGLGGGWYHPPHGENQATTLGGNTTLGRGEVELFVGAPSPATPRNAHTETENGHSGKNGTVDDKKRATTGWHTDFQENFTIQLSGVKRWTLRRGRVRHPLRATTPHYARDAGVVESQLKAARLACRTDGHPVEVDASNDTEGAYGFEYGDHNAIGPEATITMHPGDVLYFPSGMWHRVESLSPGVSLNVSLMGTTHAALVCEALHHLLVGTDARWREVVACRPGREEEDVARLQGLLEGVGDVVERFVTEGGGARSLLPPALRRPLSAPREVGGRGEESSDDDDGDNDDDDDDGEQVGADEHGDASIVDAEEEDDDDDDDDVPASAIVVDMDTFEGPEGWTAAMPPDAALAKNPLASLMSMSDIAGGRDEDPSRAPPRRRYVLNVNYAGNEMMESHLRVLLETSSSSVQSQIEGFLECEARGLDPCRDRLRREDAVGMAPLLCLLYYGYFTWNDAQKCN